VSCCSVLQNGPATIVHPSWECPRTSNSTVTTSACVRLHFSEEPRFAFPNLQLNCHITQGRVFPRRTKTGRFVPIRKPATSRARKRSDAEKTDDETDLGNMKGLHHHRKKARERNTKEWLWISAATRPPKHSVADNAASRRRTRTKTASIFVGLAAVVSSAQCKNRDAMTAMLRNPGYPGNPDIRTRNGKTISRLRSRHSSRLAKATKHSNTDLSCLHLDSLGNSGIQMWNGRTISRLRNRPSSSLTTGSKLHTTTV